MTIPKINSKILLSGASIAAAAALVVGATFAFFSDTETSEGNVIAAGEIDLKVDNTCYYNGQACTAVEISPDVFQSYWGGIQEQGNECGCTWEPKDLVEGDFFFELADVKPGDWEEDTISLNVGSNDAWVCADVTLTLDDDNDCTEPENDEEGANCPTDGSEPDLDETDGDLADNLEFIWWADDGDNVLETCTDSDVVDCVEESPLPSGVLGNASVDQTITVDLVDSNDSIWDPANPSPSPFPGRETQYIGKGWCFGDLVAAPLIQDGSGTTITPAGPNGGGFTCNGALVNNASQTDSVEMDISFRAIQARNNPSFECNVPSPV